MIGQNKVHMPFLMVSDGQGKLFDISELYMLGMSLNRPVLPDMDEVIALPPGSNIFHLPDRIALGYDPKKDEIVEIERYRGRRVYPVAAFVAPAYTQLYRAAFIRQDENTVRLPLYAYTAAGWGAEGFVTTAVRVDDDCRQDFDRFDEGAIEKGAEKVLATYPNNRLVSHLVENCVRCYGCPAARNFVLGRWECPVPTSPSCNARCVGCISHQPATSGVVASQHRLSFVPTVDEIVEYTVPHLQTAPSAIISFGQGCEGEPLLQPDLLEQSIAAIRSQTKRGTINLNSNASKPKVIDKLCRAGLDSLRVSLSSAQPDLYRQYYQPVGYSFSDVVESIRVARENGIWISLNYFIFPGLTDQEAEMRALFDLLLRFRIDMIQMRNLNMDPDWMIDLLRLDVEVPPAIGILNWMRRVESVAPWVRLGYFNPPLKAESN
ncbi:radical SAM protein [candidate division KSB1 bacterium]|nr:radical SAM protein [candidate division KSB1 bacterium]